MKKHSREKNVNCVECNQSSTQAGTLKMHIMKHSGEKPYICEQCNQLITQTGNIKRHFMEHSGDKTYNWVSFHMALKSSGLVESFLTNVTRIRTSSGMYSFVSVEVWFVREPLAACTANIGLHSKMNSFVIFQIIQFEERLGADVTLMTSLCEMVSFNMITKNGGKCVVIFTELTGKHWFLFSMLLFHMSV